VNSELGGVVALSCRLAATEDLDALLDVALAGLASGLGLAHSMLLVVEEGTDRLVLLASHGYARAGVGAEVELGVGTIGVAAARGVPIRIGNLRAALRYARTTREQLVEQKGEAFVSREIPMPGLEDVDSQLAVPMLAQGRLMGAICVESSEPAAFDATTEQVLALLANQIAAGIALASPVAEQPARARVQAEAGGPAGAPVRIRYYHEDSSLFLDGQYLIKSLPGRILWRLLTQQRDEGRREFTNKELRLDAALQLPPIKDNLETRLILLRRRLEERTDAIRLLKAGRGRFRLELGRPFVLEEV